MPASRRDHSLLCASGAPGVTALMTPGAFMAPPVARAPGAAPKAGAPWYTIHAEANGAAEIEIYGYIGQAYDYWTGEKIGVSAQSFIDELKALKAGTALTVRINSPGGDVFDGTTIYNRLVQWEGGVSVIIDGLAASAASVIAMAGKTIAMPPTAMLMIHNPWSWAVGESKDFRKAADTLDTIRDAMMASYRAANPTMPEKDLVAALDAETWYTAEAAADAGFPVELIEAGDTANAAAPVFMASLRRFHNVPQALLEAAVKDEAETTETPPADPVEPVVEETVESETTTEAETTEEQTPAPEAAGDLQEQVTALAATVAALTKTLAERPAPEAPKAKVDATSPAVVAMRGVAALSGREQDFDDAIAAGRTIAELQARFVGGSAQPRITTSAVVPDPAIVKASTTQPKSAAQIYALRKQQQQKDRK